MYDSDNNLAYANAAFTLQLQMDVFTFSSAWPALMQWLEVSAI